MKKVLLVFVLAVFGIVVNAQKISIVSGSFGVLKNETEVKVELKFDNILMMKENYTEAQYLERRKKDVLANPKRGEEGWAKWSSEWNRYRNQEYVSYFIKGLGKSSKNRVYKTDSNAKYTIVVDTKWVFPGWHGGFVGMTAEITGTVKLIETNNPSVVLAEMQFNKYDKSVKNNEYVMEYGRIAGAYESLGTKVGKEIKAATK